MSTLQNLITEKQFDNHAGELEKKSAQQGIDFAYQYGADGNSLSVWFNFGNIPATVEARTDGSITFTSFVGGGRTIEKFKNATADDVLGMAETAFIFLRDGNLKEKEAWYNSLEKDF